MQLSERLITPKEAETLLQRNQKNRRISPQRVLKYADAMKRGEWRDCESMILIDSNGVLINGQHRLLAIIEAKAPQRFVVKTGVAPESFEVIDTGAGRTIADALGITGYHNSKTLGSALRHLWFWQHGVQNKMGRKSPSIVELSAVLKKYPQTVDSVHAVRNQAANRIAPPAVMAAWHMILGLADENRRDSFFEGLVEGVHPDRGVLKLRDRLIDERLEGVHYSAQLAHLSSLVFSTWNRILRGEKIERVTEPKSWQWPEGLPKSWWVDVQPAETASTNGQELPEATLAQKVLKLLADGEVHRFAHMAEALDVKQVNLSGVMTRLVRRKLVKKTGLGQYRITFNLAEVQEGSVR